MPALKFKMCQLERALVCATALDMSRLRRGTLTLSSDDVLEVVGAAGLSSQKVTVAGLAELAKFVEDNRSKLPMVHRLYECGRLFFLEVPGMYMHP